MNPHVDQVLEQFHGIWRFRWLALAVAITLAALGWLIVFSLPDHYGARAEVLVDTRTALKPALDGLAVQQDVTVQLNYVRESLLASPQLLRIAELSGVMPVGLLDPARQEAILNGMRKRILLTVESPPDTSASATYGILYQDVNRARAYNVVRILLDTLVKETLTGKHEGAENAQQFLQSQIKAYEQRLHLAEERLADFKSQHLGQMPSEQGGYFAQLQKESDAVEDTRTKLITAQSRRATLESQLHGPAILDTAVSQTTMTPNGATPMDTQGRIAETQAHLDQLLLQYTDNHPDVIAARAQLADLKARREAEIESLKRGDASAAAASGASTNPVYQSIRLALNQADVEISDLRAQLAQHEAKEHELRRFVNTAPQVEAEYAQLARDYDVNKAQYTALLSNYEKGRVGENADTAGSVRFEVVQPPTVGYQPVSPRRNLLLIGVLLGALAAGAGLAYQLDRMRPVVGSSRGLAQLTGVAAVTVVGQAFPTRTQALIRREAWQISLALTCLLIAFIVQVTLSSHGYRITIPALKNLVRSWV
jgi:polysaccharide chain length determinant protein (PEP-CTERM system associated)